MRVLPLLLLLCPLSAYAADAQTWTIIPAASHIRFTAVENNAQTSGEFPRFTTTIHFDEKDLANSNVKAEIDMASVKSDYEDIANNLVTSDWFDVTKFPKATFESHQFRLLNDNHYQAIGTLTIRDKTVPVTLPFTITHPSADVIHMDGALILKRTAFGVGQGEWTDTKTVADNVTVEVTLDAKKD